MGTGPSEGPEVGRRRSAQRAVFRSLERLRGPQGGAAFRALDLDPASLVALTCPVLVVIGDRDFNAPADGLVEALPDASLKVLRHLDHLGTPNDFGAIDATLSFLGAV